MTRKTSSQEIVIKLSNVKKMYKLGQIGGGTLQGDLQSWWARIRGKEDPNLKLDVDQRLIGKTFMALNGIDLEIYRGEALGIIGSNGAGKSTLLKLLCRVTAPSEGEIDIYGRIASMLEVGTGFNGEMTGRENIYMNGTILGMTKAEIDEKLDEIVEFSEVRDFIDTPVKRYSSGMYVKLAFSVAAHLDSEIMIMDEVLAVGDMNFQKKCLKKMREAAKNDKRTVLYVSHNMNTIRKLCDRCIVLDQGRIIFQGNVEDAISVYMESNADNRLSYDYSNIPRSQYETRKLQLTGCDIVERNENKVQQGDILKLILHCKANTNVQDIGFRFEIIYLDDSIAGTIFSNKTINAEAGMHLDLFISIPTKNLAPGKYRAIALAYEKDQYGNQVGVDRVSSALAFEIIDNGEDLLWLHQYWGHVRFDDMIISDL